MELNLGLDPRDPRYQQMVAAMVREGKLPPSATMESQVNAQANAPISSGMMGAYVDQAEAGEKAKAVAARSRDISGQERKIKSQRDYANSLRGKGAPKGRTAGPYDVYYGPNWGESLASASGEIMGGYMSGKADEADAALDEQRSAIGLEKASAEQERYDAEQAMKNRIYEETVRGNLAGETASAATLAQRTASDAATLEEQKRGRMVNETLAQDKETRAAEGTWENISVHMPGTGKPGTMVYNEDKGEWRRGSKEGDKVPFAEAEKILEYTASTTGGSVPAAIQKDMAARRVGIESMAASIEEIQRLDALGKDTSGMRSVALSFVPPSFKGVVENAMYDSDEMKQRAKNVYMDAQIMEAATDGVLSDEDAIRLKGINIAAEGLTPEQQVLRLYGVTEILSLYDIKLDMSGDPKESEEDELLNKYLKKP